MRTTNIQAVITHPLLAEAGAANHLKNTREAILALVEKFKRLPVKERMPGQDIVCALLKSPFGKDIFFEDEEWRDTLTKTELNELSESGNCVLQRLASDKRLLALIDEDELFRRKIITNGFCHGGRTSIAYQMVAYTSAIPIMHKHPELMTLLTADLLNAWPSFEILPVVYELAKTEVGISLLAYPQVRARVTVEGLNAGNHYHSTFSFLMKFAAGIDLLVDDEFRLKLQAETLNRYNEHDKYSALSRLCLSQQGCEHIANYADLAKKISREGFNKASSSNITPAFCLARSTAGVRAYAAHKRLIKLLDEQTLNLISKDPADKGTSLLFCLLVQPGGDELLVRNTALFKELSDHTLGVIVEAGEHAGLSLARLLLQPEHAVLLQQLPRDVQANVRQAAIPLVVSLHASPAVTFARSAQMEEVEVPRAPGKSCAIL